MREKTKFFILLILLAISIWLLWYMNHAAHNVLLSQ